MKILFLVLVITALAHAQTYELSNGSSSYTAKAFGKTVEGVSNQLKGKMVCQESECEILVAAPVKTYVSSDSNRDSNMEQAVEALKFPVTSGKGKFPKINLGKDKWVLPLEIDFHGVKKTYNATVSKTKDQNFKADFILALEDHKVERPSFFTVKVQNEVPMHFVLEWRKKE